MISCPSNIFEFWLGTTKVLNNDQFQDEHFYEVFIKFWREINISSQCAARERFVVFQRATWSWFSPQHHWPSRATMA